MPERIDLHMVINDGLLDFDKNEHLDNVLLSWVGNLSPEDLIQGTYRFSIPVEIESWDEDGPVLTFVKENE